ncbi:MAG: C-GCAxxG-C-C family (seleno)protein [Bacillota bacterium]|nr:C-GCAxxG-C-C family (seleno)protein [Bacillota bacterium]
MLKELIEAGYGEAEDYNCAEKIINGANVAYDLQLDKQATKLFAGFGGGMAVGDTCGTVTAAIGVLSGIFIEERAHESKEFKLICQDFMHRFGQQMSSNNCTELRRLYRDPQSKCLRVLSAAAGILDEMLLERDMLPLNK